MIRATFAAILLTTIIVGCTVALRPAPVQGTDGLPPAPPQQTLAATLDEDLGPARRDRFGRVGRFRELHGSTACDNSLRQGNPLVWPDRSLPPTAGQPLRVQWTTTPTAPHIDTPVGYLLASFGTRQPIELTSAGFPGCLLHVDTAPRNLFVLSHDPDGTPQFTHDGDHFWLHWTPPDAFAGHEIVLQLVVSAPGANEAGWLFSPGLELWIGSGVE